MAILGSFTLAIPAMETLAHFEYWLLLAKLEFAL